MSKTRLAISVILGMASAWGTVQGSVSNSFGQATGYNAFIFGNFTDTSNDVGGNLAVGGKTTVSSFAVGQKYVAGNAASVPYAYVGVGALSGQLALDAGNAYYSGGGSGTIYLNGHNQTITKTGGSGIDFGAAQVSLSSYSSYLFDLTPSSTAVNMGPQGYGITANSAGLNVVTLTSQQLSQGALHITLAPGATLLINVIADSTGAASNSNNGIFINGVQSYGDNATGASNIVFNFTGSTFNGKGTIVGTLLAPNATFDGFGQQLDGELIANNVIGATEFHDELFAGVLPTSVATPEPAYSILLGAGFISVGFARKLIKRS